MQQNELLVLPESFGCMTSLEELNLTNCSWEAVKQETTLGITQLQARLNQIEDHIVANQLPSSEDGLDPETKLSLVFDVVPEKVTR